MYRNHLDNLHLVTQEVTYVLLFNAFTVEICGEIDLRTDGCERKFNKGVNGGSRGYSDCNRQLTQVLIEVTGARAFTVTVSQDIDIVIAPM